MKCDLCGSGGDEHRVEILGRDGSSVLAFACAECRLKARKRGAAVALISPPAPPKLEPVTPEVRAEYDALRAEYERIRFERDEWKFIVLYACAFEGMNVEDFAEPFMAWRHTGQDMQAWILAKAKQA